MIKLKTINQKSYISIFNFIKIPCSYIGSRYHRIFKIAGFRITVVFCDIEGRVYVYPLKNSGINFSFKIKKKSMKARHFRELKLNNYDSDYIVSEVRRIAHKYLRYEIDIDNPVTFNEKIIWTKLQEKNPLISTCCDKYSLKAYVEQTIGQEYVLPVICSWKDCSEISFEELPDSFVLKVNWSSGYNIIVRDKKELNEYAALKIIGKWTLPESNSYYHFFNYGYRDVKPVIYAEPYIEESNGQLNDYKFFINNGKLIFVLMATDRCGEEPKSLTYYDSELNKLPFTRGNADNKDIAKPKRYDEMVDLAIILAKPFTFVRVDFYEDINDNIYVGEMTFYTGGGLTRFDPPEWDEKLGKMIHL